MKKLITITGLFFVLLGGCKDYLDIVPKDDVESIKTVFEQRNQVFDWVETCYSWLPSMVGVPDNIGLTGADELVSGDYLRIYTQYPLNPLYIGDGAQSAHSPYCGKWENTSFYAAIRYCNTFLEHIGETRNMTQEEKDQWTAEVKAVKALYYFELIRMYGPIILVPQNIEITTPVEGMKRPRSHVDTCFNEVVRLLDEAIPVLDLKDRKALSRQGYFTKEAAAALKAKVRIYQASPLFNGNTYYAAFKGRDGEPLFSSTPDKEKWKIAAEACDEAVKLCEDNNWELVQGNSDKDTRLLNIMADIEHSVQMPNYKSSEIVWATKWANTELYKEYHLYTYVLPRLEFEGEYGSHANTNLLGCLAPSLKMVEMYYTENGVPMEEDKEWQAKNRYERVVETEASTTYKDVISENEEVLTLHLRREPRFYASIAADRTYWQRGKGEGNKLLVKAWRKEGFGAAYPSLVSQSPQNRTGYWLKKHTFSDVATVEYDKEMKNAGDLPWPLIRLAELYLWQAEAWNEYLETPDDEHVCTPLNKVRRRAGLLGVKEAWQQYSTNPAKPDTQEGMREIIRRETNIELAFEGHRFWNLRRWKIAHEELNEPQKGWNVVGTDAEGFYNHGEPFVVWAKRKFVAPRDYFFPIRSEEVQVSGVVQNLGW